MFEVEFPSAIDVVESVSFLDMHDSFRVLSGMTPLSYEKEKGLTATKLESADKEIKV